MKFSGNINKIIRIIFQTLLLASKDIIVLGGQRRAYFSIIFYIAIISELRKIDR